METFLSPIEKPSGLMMKLTYFFTKKMFGKVLTPLKVHSARLPTAFGMFYGKISQLDKKLVLPLETVMLIRVQVARINLCLFCMDIARWSSIKSSLNVAKFDELGNYENSPLYKASDKALLDYVSELVNKKVKPETFNWLTNYFSEREICEIVYLVASEHVYNITNIGLNIHSDMLCEVPKK